MHTATTPTINQPTARQATYSVAEVAQRLGWNWTERKLFAWLRAQRILLLNRDGINLPATEWVTRGYFVVHHTSYSRGGVLCHGAHTRITTTGVIWLAQQMAEATHGRQ